MMINYSIDLAAAKNVSLSIENVLGKKIISNRPLENLKGNIDVSNFVSGIYIIHLNANDKNYTAKFIKE
jgi:hypothetical protein